MAKARTWFLGAGCLLVVFGVVIFALLVRGLSTPSLPREMVLSLRLAGPIAEVTADDPLAELMGEEATSLRKVREALVRAAEDDRVAGLRLRVDSIGGGFATAQELRSLIARVNAAGKWTAAYMDTAGEFRSGNLVYYVASACDEVSVNPQGDLNLIGLSSRVPFIRGTFDKLDIRSEFPGRGAYKTARFMYTNTEFTPAHREMIEWLLNRARPYVFSTAMPSAIAAAASVALQIVRNEPGRRRELLTRAESLRSELTAQGWDVGGSASQIIPLIVGEPARAVELASALRDRGLFVPAIRPPTVPQGEACLRVSLTSGHTEEMVAAVLDVRGSAPGDKWLRKVAGWTWRVKLSLSMMLELMGDLRTRAQDEAIAVFARNLKDLLFAAPAGARPTLGLDPGIRTGVKAAVVDATGKLVATETLYPFQPKNDLRGAQVSILKLIAEHGVELIAIGNGTASRETERMVAEVLNNLPAKVKAPTKVVVSEAGASVYSASELAAREFPAEATTPVEDPHPIS